MATLDSIFIGFDIRPAEVQAYAVARNSIRRRLNLPIPIRPLILSELQKCGLYKRPIDINDGRLFDRISLAPMSTEFAITRFLIPHLVQNDYALFVDADVLARENVAKIMNDVDPTKAVSVVKHKYDVSTTTKMDGQIQTSYERKNWSSVVVWNTSHKSHSHLTLDRINGVRGLWLHQFSWLDDSEIGELDPKWNFLVGHTDRSHQPALVHFTDGIPSMDGYRDCEYADLWFEELNHWAR
jgi:lipopolysaccharide biosynthesis glycosyltransferase